MTCSVDSFGAIEIVEKLRELLALLDRLGFHEVAIDVNQAIEKLNKQIEITSNN